jgi:hypothetical protein
MRLLVTFFLAAVATITAVAQVRVPNIPLPRDLPLPGIDRLLRGESPVSTSLRDARREVPFLDQLDVKFGDLATLRNQRGAFALKPGHWTLDLQSFCFRPGTRAPQRTDGNGYLSAGIAGPHGEIFAQMLTKYGTLRDVEQRDMQVLVWALLSRTKIRQMNPRMQALAVRVLTPAQIVALDSGALDVIPPALRQRAFNALPAEIRAIATVENRIREVLYRANHTYAELERLAVIGGPEPKDGRNIPKQRWTIHPDGYFVRYQPHGLARTTVHVAMPPKYQIRRDGKGRIVSIAFSDGRRTEVEYNDAIPAFEPAGLPAAAYAFRSIRMTRPGQARSQIVVNNQGWTFVNRRPARRVMQFGFVRAVLRQGFDFAGWKERWDEWSGRAETWNDLWENVTDPPPDADEAIDDLGDSEHLHDGIDAALNGDPSDRLDWIIDNRERQNAALERATIIIATLPDGSDDEEPEYVPPYDIALPGSSGGQRLGFSSRGF